MMKNYKNKDWLNQKYLIEKLNTYQIAKLCNRGSTTIWYWLHKLNIPIRSYSKAGHLARGNHCHLSNEAKQWINGELMSDGCLISRSLYSARYFHVSKYLEYAQYISDTLNSFGIKQSGKIYKYKDKNLNCYTYHYISLQYGELFPIYEKWYIKGKKIIPRDLKLTPLTLRQEYIGDGHLSHPKNGRPLIELATCGFLIKDVEWLVKQLNKIGFKSTRQPAHNVIGISTYSVKDFLGYIGFCPVKCYQYKWSY